MVRIPTGYLPPPVISSLLPNNVAVTLVDFCSYAKFGDPEETKCDCIAFLNNYKFVLCLVKGFVFWLMRKSGLLYIFMITPYNLGVGIILAP